MTRVADLFSPCSTLRPEDSLATAAKALWEGACDGLPVVDAEGHLLGLVSDRDVAMCAAIEGRTPYELLVSLAMTGSAEGLAQSASLADAHAFLRERRTHRAAVLDAEGLVLGMLTFADLVRDAQARPSARKAAADVKDTLVVLSGAASVEATSGSAPTRTPAAAHEIQPTAAHALKTGATRAKPRRAAPKAAPTSASTDAPAKAKAAASDVASKATGKAGAGEAGRAPKLVKRAAKGRSAGA